MTPYTVWAIVAALWLIGIPIWRYTADRKALPLEDGSEQWIRSAIWPVLVLLVVTLWLGLKGWPLLLVAGLVGLLFAATTGMLS